MILLLYCALGYWRIFSAAIMELAPNNSELCIVSEAEFSVLWSSVDELASQTEASHESADSQPASSRFYRSLSTDSDTSNDLESGDLELDRSQSSSHRQPPSIFFLEHSFTDDEASAAESRTAVHHADTGVSQPSQSASAEFENLLKMMFGREGSSCVSEDDRPARHGSLGNFVVPKGSFGSAVLPHVSSFG